MKRIYKLLSESTQKFYCQETTPKTKLKNVLNELTASRSKEEYNGTFGSLFKNIVYVIFNHTPLIESKNNRRTFVAIINWENISPYTKNHIESNRYCDDGMIVESDAIFFNKEGVSDFVNNNLSALWKKTWKEYLNITNQLSNENKYTFNEYLLKYAGCPLDIGISWGEDIQDEQSYVHLNSSIFESIGLPKIAGNDWIKKTSMLGEHDCLSLDILPPALNKFKGDLEEMNPINIEHLGESICCMPFYLLKYYAIWGGNAFLSLPIVHGSKPPNNTGVVSICSKQPLTEVEQSRWKIIGHNVLQPLIAGETELLIKEQGRLERVKKLNQSVYGLGHLLKNRTAPAVTSIKQIRTTNEVNKSLLKEVANSLEATRSLGFNLDILANSQIENEGENIFTKKNKWHREKSLSLTESIEKILQVAMPTVRGGIPKKLLLENNIPNCEVTPWITYKENKVRPTDEFYSHILHEILINSLNYGLPNLKGEVKMIIKANKKGIKIGNYCSDKQFKELFESLKLRPNTWMSYDEIDILGGGLKYVSLMANCTNIGELHIKIKDGLKKMFWVKVNLRGFKNTKNHEKKIRQNTDSFN